MVEQADGGAHIVVFGGSCHDPADPACSLTNDLWICDLTYARGGCCWSRLHTDGAASHGN
jgi:hypothetical protein